MIDIWHLDLSELSVMKARIIKYLKVFIMTVRGFTTDKANIQAHSLTYYSTMSLVPLVAVVFAVTKGFGYGNEMEQLIFKYFEGNEQIINYLLKFADNIIASLENGLFGFITFIILISAVIYLMLNVERAFNDVWKVSGGRPLHKRLIFYPVLLMSFPFILLIFMSLGLIYTDALKSIGLELDRYVPITSIFTWLLLYGVVVLVFSMMYFLIPNTKVKFAAAFNSALILAFAFIVVQVLYVETQLLVTGLNTVYGVFAAIPLFLVWMNISWTLILFGAELSHSFQNVDNYKIS
ncbi:MAG TPA: YihY/virulence factor BrkB family protein [Bacteroidales bacterium]|jgi:membrane protein|nr:YihY/virulence factor BrkB family protein [Bacteroidales bacterium]